MTSGGGYNVPLNIAMLNMTNPKKYNGTGAYGFHKRAQIVLNQYWRDKYGARGITFYVMHPGWADTDGVKRSLPRFRKILKSILRDAESGADTALWLAARGLHSLSRKPCGSIARCGPRTFIRVRESRRIRRRPWWPTSTANLRVSRRPGPDRARVSGR